MVAGATFTFYRRRNGVFAQYTTERENAGLNGGEGGIRTPDTLLGCNCLAGSPVRPLQHLSAETVAKIVKRRSGCQSQYSIRAYRAANRVPRM
jgi:hypothetical protein